jgi:hypothetical protein
MARSADPRREQFWRETIAAWEKSGRSIRDFCSSRQVSESSFHAWRRTLLERDCQRPVTRPGPTLVPVRVVPDTAVLEVVLPAGLVVRVPAGADADAVAQLVAALRAASC